MKRSRDAKNHERKGTQETIRIAHCDPESKGHSRMQEREEIRTSRGSSGLVFDDVDLVNESELLEHCEELVLGHALGHLTYE